MEPAMEDDIWGAAVRWHAEQEREDCDWDAFTAWLEADDRHRLALDEVALLDDQIVRVRPVIAQSLPPLEAEPRGTGFSRRWAGLGIAAATAAVAAVTLPMLGTGGGQIAYNTAPGETRSIELADGSRVQLAAASSLTMAKGDVHEMTLKGAAWFDIPHNPARSLVIHAGNFRVTDIGTKFEVNSNEDSLRVAVAEGSLTVASESLPRPISLEGGQRFVAARNLDLAEVTQFDNRDVGSWRHGRLVYRDAPLALVAADISRYAPTKVVVDPAIAGRRFSGVLSIGDGSGLVGNLQQFMGLAAHKEGDRIRLVARHGS